VTTVYFIRHAEADFNVLDDRTRPLTMKGAADSALVTDFLHDKKIDVIFSSPYRRSIDTISGFAESVRLPINKVEEFRECQRALLEDWRPYAEMQWADFSYKQSDDECLAEVQDRNITALNEILNQYKCMNIVIGTHGIALSTIINYYDNSFVFSDFMDMVFINPWVVMMNFDENGYVGMKKVDLFKLNQESDYDCCKTTESLSTGGKTGWERSNRTHFDDIAENFDKVRWDYPDELFEDIFKYTNHGNGLKDKGKKAVEIGAGTGKATAPFLNAGYEVTAVEMGANMSRFLLDKYNEYPNLKVITSTFEDASLEDENYDLIYAAAAFHWVDAEIGCPKVFRLLKKGGFVALFRYNVIPSVNDPCYDEVQEVYEKHYYNYYTTSLRPVKKTHKDFCTPEEIYHSFRFYDLKDYGFSDISMTFYDMTTSITADERIALMETMSDHRGLPEENRKALYAEQKEVILRHGNRYTENITYQLYMGRKNS